MKEIQLTQKCMALVDDCDFDRLFAIRWCVTVNRQSGLKYAVGTINKKQIRMHRFLLGITDPRVVVDHVNGNTLDNTRANLRTATPSQNLANTGRRKNNTSGFKGVHFTKRRFQSATPWAAYLGALKKNRFLGYYPTAEDAARAYDKAALAVYAEFAKLNFKNND